MLDPKLLPFDYKTAVQIHEAEGYADVAGIYHMLDETSDTYKPFEYLQSLGFTLGKSSPYTGFYRVTISRQ